MQKLIQITGGKACCSGPNCPTVFRVSETGAFVIQGKKLGAELRHEMAMPGHEDAVEVPAAVIEELVARLRS